MHPNRGNLPRGERWTAFDAFSWLAFGEVRAATADFMFPKSEWSRDWLKWPPESLAFAFAEIETGVQWQPVPNDPNLPAGPDSQRVWARRIMANTGESASQLRADVTADFERYLFNLDRWKQAQTVLNNNIRDGQLRVWAIRRLQLSEPDPAGVHVLVDPLVFMDTRFVSEYGQITDQAGTYCDRAILDSSEVRRPSLAALMRRAGVTATVAAEGRLRAWLEAEMQRSPDVSPGKDEMMRRAIAAGYWRSGAGFERAWAQAATNTGGGWSRAGRKSKRGNQEGK